MYKYFSHRMHGRYFFYMYLLCPVAYAPVPRVLACVILGMEIKKPVHILSIAYKNKSENQWEETKRKRERERKKER
jgi:hypothetical protein